MAHLRTNDQKHHHKWVSFPSFIPLLPGANLTSRSIYTYPTSRLYFGILARLYRLTGNQMYFQYSMNTLNWWLTWGFETTTGRVHDTITGPSCTITGLQTWTYNSGAFLFGLADLYYATGNTTLLDLGRSMAYAAIRDFSNLDTGVLSESCEYDGQPSADLPPGCQQDEIVVRGHFLWLLYGRV